MQDRLFRALLRLLPGEVRDGYARDMEATFRAERRDAPRGAALLRWWLLAVADLLRSAPGHHWDILRRDVRHAWRVLVARPLHFTAAAGTLALGLGAAIAMFAVADAVLWRPLPYANARELVTIQETSGGQDPSNLGYLTFADLRRQARSVQAMSAASQSIVTLTGGGRDAERINVMRTSASYFTMAGVTAAIGRTFTEAEDAPGPVRRVAVLSDALWRRRFNADPAIVNQTIQVSGIPFTVVGVMPADFNDMVAAQLYRRAEMWTPLGYDPAASFACRTCRHLRVFARLNPGVDPASAEREFSGLIAAAALAQPAEYDRPGIAITRLDDLFLGPVRPVLLVLMGGVVLLLLVACGNVANLLLIRATEREQEVAVRIALGVTAGRLVRSLFTESVLLAFVGLLAALPLAHAALAFIIDAGPANLPRLQTASLDLRAIAVAGALALSTAVLFGLLPALHVRKRHLFTALREGSRRSATVATWRVRSLLVAGNMTMAAVLMVGSGLVVRSLMGLLAIDTGFTPDRVLTADLALAGAQFATSDDAKDIAATVQFYDDLLGRIRALPGVESAAAVTTLPLGGNLDAYGLHVTGRPLANPESAPYADRFIVTPAYFETVRTPLVRGRLLDASDSQQAPRVAVVNATLAREVFPGEDPIGRAVSLGGGGSAPERTIVGVVGDVRHLGLDEPARYQVYVPQAQWAWAETGMTLVVRAAGDPGSLAEPVRQVLRAIDPSQPLSNVRRYDDVVRAATGPRRFAAQLLIAFAVVALVLASVGLYGALGVVAGQRHREIGLRLALGADGGRIGRLLFFQGLRPAMGGLLAGLAIAAAAGGVLRSLLYGVTTLDAATFGASAVVLLAAAAFACALPARRASRVNPATALRGD